MKIVIINGSPRENGATGQILSLIEKNIRSIENTAEIEYVQLGKMDLKFCSGCLSCYKTGKCYLKDDVEKISKKIAESNGVIFASPTYASNVTSQLKVLIDRGGFVFEQLLRDKACFSVVTYENAGANGAMKIINDLIRFSGGAVACKYKLKLNHGNTTAISGQEVKIANLTKKFIVKCKLKSPFRFPEKIFRDIIFNFGLKPHALKNKERYKGIIEKWKDLDILGK